MKSKPAGTAATKLLAIGGGPVGELLGQIVVSAVQDNCHWLIKQAIKVVQSILVTRAPPAVPVVSSFGAYLNHLTAQRVNTIASQLRVSGDYVVATRNAVCSAVGEDRSAADVIAARFGRARLQHLTAMNAFVRFVVDSCRGRGLDLADANFISGAVLNLVLANEFQSDLAPPVVEIYRTAGLRLPSGSALLSAWFRIFDRGELQSCDIRLGYGGSWHPQYGGGCGYHSALLPAGTRYAWAFRATDNAGHASQWAVTYTGTA